MKKEIVALYCRLSTEDENTKGKDSESESIQNQRLLLIEHARKEGWEIYHIYSDSDYSGLDDKRPDFCKMLEAAKMGEFSIILCKTQSRFTRNMETAERYLHYYFLIWGIRFVTVVDHVDTSLLGNKKVRQINGLINEWYCEEISENIRLVFKRKMEMGQFLGNYAPYGYNKNPDNRHELVIDYETKNVVVQIFDWYVEGYSCKKIAMKLTELKILTPWQIKCIRGQDKGRKNVTNHGIWSESTVSKILKNQVYIGDMIQGRERKISFKDSKVINMPKNEWIIVSNTHREIVSPETFLQAENKMKSKSKK